MDLRKSVVVYISCYAFFWENFVLLLYYTVEYISLYHI